MARQTTIKMDTETATYLATLDVLLSGVGAYIQLSNGDKVYKHAIKMFKIVSSADTTTCLTTAEMYEYLQSL